MNLTVLGCGGGLGTGEKTTSMLLDGSVLIDAGTGVGSLSVDEMAGIEAVFLTHAHMDHICFLPFMADTLFGRRQASLPIYGRPETLTALRDHVFNDHIWPDFTRLPARNPIITLHPVGPGEVTTIGHLAVTAIPVPHVVPAQAFYVTDGKRGFAFSGDTTTNDSFWDALNAQERLDTLVMECAFSDAAEEISRISQHYCPSMLAADMVKLRHQPTIYLSHPKPGSERAILEQCQQQIPERDIRGLSSGDRITV